MPRVRQPLPLIAMGGAVIAVAAASGAGAVVPSATSPLPEYSDQTPPVVTVAVLTGMRSSLVRKGLQATVTIDEPGSIVVTIFDASHRQVSKSASGTASVPNGGPTTLAVALTPGTRVKVRRGAKVRWTIQTTATDAYGNTRTVKTPYRVR